MEYKSPNGQLVVGGTCVGVCIETPRDGVAYLQDADALELAGFLIGIVSARHGVASESVVKGIAAVLMAKKAGGS